MSDKSERLTQLGADIRAYKDRVTALGVDKEFTKDLDGFAGQVETIAFEIEEQEKTEPEQTEAKKKVSGKLSEPEK